MKKPLPVRVVVGPSGGGVLVKVYNLTLLEHNAYYANGILVQNCADAVAVGLYGAIQRGFQIARLSSEYQRRGKDWRTEFRKKSEEFWRNGELVYAT